MSAGGATTVAWAPGRVNLIGEHTDYAGGLALPFAIERGVTVTATPSDVFDVHALDLGERDAFAPQGIERVAGWRAFVRGVVAELSAAGFDVRPARLEITGDLQRGGGLSSSAALEAALCLALVGETDRVALAKLCARVENEWVGAQTGLLDQLAVLLARAGHALRIDFTTLDTEHVPLDLGDWRLVTLDSGVVHSHADGAY